jgi:hypothetical protein
MQKWIRLLPALALCNFLPPAQAQLVPGYGPRPGQPGRYDVHKPSLSPQPGMSPTLQGIYRDAQTATKPWSNHRSEAAQPASPFGPQSPCWPPDPFDPQCPWGPQSSYGPHGIIPGELRVAHFLDHKQNGNSSSGASAQMPAEVLTQLVNPPKIDPPFEPVTRPGVAPTRHKPFAAPSWLRWEWMAGLFVLILLACLLRNYIKRKPTAR